MGYLLFIVVCHIFLNITLADAEIACFERWNQRKYAKRVRLSSEKNLIDCLNWCISNTRCKSADWAQKGGCFVNTKNYVEGQRKLTTSANDHYKKYTTCKFADRACLKDLPRTTFTRKKRKIPLSFIKFTTMTAYGAKTQDVCITICQMSINCWGVEWNKKELHCLFWDTKPPFFKARVSKNIFTVTKTRSCNELPITTTTDGSAVTATTTVVTAHTTLVTTTASVTSGLYTPGFTETSSGTPPPQCVPQIKQTNDIADIRHEKLYRYEGDSYYSRHEHDVCFSCFKSTSRIHCAIHCTNIDQCSRFIYHVTNNTCCTGI